MSGLEWPVLSFSLASGAALGCLFVLFRSFSRLLGLKKLGTALLDVLFGGLAGGFVFLCALAVDSGRLRLYQVLPQALGAWAAVTALGPWTRRGAGALQKIFCRLWRLLGAAAGFLRGLFGQERAQRDIGGNFPEKRGKNTKKRLEKFMYTSI